MKKLIVLVFILVASVSFAQEKDFKHHHAGFVLGGLIYSDGKFDNTDLVGDLDAGFYMQFSYKYSFIKYLGIKPFFSFSYASLDKKSGKMRAVGGETISYDLKGDMTTIGLGAMLELSVPIDRVEFYAAFGLGYYMNKLKLDLDAEDSVYRYYLEDDEFEDNKLGFQAEAGVEYKITDLFSLGGKIIYMNNKFSKTHAGEDLGVKLNAYVIGVSGTFSF